MYLKPSSDSFYNFIAHDLDCRKTERRAPKDHIMLFSNHLRA